MKAKIYRCFLVFFFTSMTICADIVSEKARLRVIPDFSNGEARLTLAQEGVGLGSQVSSANLDVSGNAALSEGLKVGETEMNFDLSVHGKLAMSYELHLSDSSLGLDSVYYVDSTSGNVNLMLPSPSTLDGSVVSIKKTVDEHDVIISAGVNLIDSRTSMALMAGFKGGTQLVSASGNWYVLSHRHFEWRD